jgi:hypothetical protein
VYQRADHRRLPDCDSGFFEVAFDRNADRKFDFFAYVFYASPLRGVLVNKAGDVVNAGLPVRLLSNRTVQIQVPHRLIGDPEGYDVATFSIYRDTPCTNKNPMRRFDPEPVPAHPPRSHRAGFPRQRHARSSDASRRQDQVRPTWRSP